MVRVTEARSTLPDLIARVEGGEEITLTRHGTPVAVLVRPDALRVRRAARALHDADVVHQLVEQAPTTPPWEGRGLDVAWAERLVAEIRADRDQP